MELGAPCNLGMSPWHAPLQAGRWSCWGAATRSRRCVLTVLGRVLTVRWPRADLAARQLLADCALPCLMFFRSCADRALTTCRPGADAAPPGAGAGDVPQALRPGPLGTRAGHPVARDTAPLPRQSHAVIHHTVQTGAFLLKSPLVSVELTARADALTATARAAGPRGTCVRGGTRTLLGYHSRWYDVPM